MGIAFSFGGGPGYRFTVELAPRYLFVQLTSGTTLGYDPDLGGWHFERAPRRPDAARDDSRDGAMRFPA